jgi:hypothetical protein
VENYDSEGYSMIVTKFKCIEQQKKCIFFLMKEKVIETREKNRLLSEVQHRA